MVKKYLAIISQKVKENYLLAVVLILYFAFRYRYFDYLPLWDGTFYYNDCILDSLVKMPFDIMKYNCSNHPSMVFIFLIALGQMLEPGSLFFLHLSLTIMGLFAVYAFYRIIDLLFKDVSSDLEIFLMTLIFAVFPVIMSGSVHLNLDYGVFVFLLISLYSLFSGKYFLFTLSSLGLVFSKESGIAFYTVIMSCGSFYFFIKYKLKRRKIFLKNRLYLTVIPYLLYLAYYLYKIVFRISLFWLPEQSRFHLGLYYSDTMKSSLILIFIFNFHWILSAVVGFFCLKLLLGKIQKKQFIFPVKKNKLHYVLLIHILFISGIYILTRYETFSHIRYFLPLYPLLLLIFYFSLFSLFKKPKIRIIILSVLSGLFFMANFRSFDPISKKIYGTFRFGRHELYNMTAVAKDWLEGYGTDQLVYNLQFTYLRRIQDEIYKKLGSVYLYDPYYPYTFGYTQIGQKKQIQIKELNSGFVFQTNFQPDEIYYLEYPVFKKLWDLSQMKQYYDIQNEMIFNNSGYELKVYRMVKKKGI